MSAEGVTQMVTHLSISQAKGQGLHKQIVLLFGGLIEKSALIFAQKSGKRPDAQRNTRKREGKSDVGICESSE